MDAELRLSTAPFRDARYAPRRLEAERRPDGVIVLSNPTPYSTAFQTVTEPLAHWAVQAPGRTWLAERSGEGWREVSFAEAHDLVRAIAGGLRGAGVASGRPLLILSRNNIDHALVKYAAMSQGMPAAPVSPQYGLPGANLARLAHAVQVLNPAAVYAEDAALFGEALAAPFLSGLPVVAGKNPRPGDIPLDRLLGAAPAGATARPGDPAKYLLTSGSTGLPKAVICLHRQISTNAAQIAACFDDPDPPVMVNSAPWSHSLGANAILHMAAHRGGSLYIDAGQPVAGRFGETLRNLKEISPTYHNFVPAGWMLFAGELERDEQLAATFFARVRHLQYGGAALGQDVGDRIQAIALRTVGEKISFGSGYGATETGPTACNVHWHNDRMGLAGLPVPGTAVKLVPAGDKLEFRVKGPQITSGYLGQQELSAACFDEEGFYKIGDAARFVDPDEPAQGLAYDGRLSENFKLSSGTFVGVGELRIAAVGAVGDAVTDAVVCGEGQDRVGLLFYPNPHMPRAEVEQAVRAGLTRHNAAAKGQGSRVARALVLDTPPDAGAGEITDKGYIAQALARTLRAQALQRLFSDPAPPDVMVFE
ncbi:MAG: feruloyl-CoA synthase [Phenylobacterium sp.]|uniref:feruloyl-CoA synthase n=1 Tax=Phenylobacterium sp. TaxID=1871053 RepID=UPI00391AFBFA